MSDALKTSVHSFQLINLPPGASIVWKYVNGLATRTVANDVNAVQRHYATHLFKSDFDKCRAVAETIVPVDLRKKQNRKWAEAKVQEAKRLEDQQSHRKALDALRDALALDKSLPIEVYSKLIKLYGPETLDCFSY